MKYFYHSCLLKIQHPQLALLVLICFVVAGMFATNIIVFTLYMAIGNVNFQNPDMSSIPPIALLTIQGIISVVTFILIPILVIKKYIKLPLNAFIPLSIPSLFPSILVLSAVFSFIVVNSFFIDWNMNISFPEFMSGFEAWARQMENDLMELTLRILQLENIWQLGLGLLVIAVIPAIGEELLFRGLIQNLFFNITKNVHLGIWLSAIFFGLFHLQFFGFVPRMLLGILFGYLYLWSGDLRFAILGHFLNNASMVVIFYLYHNQWIDTNPEKMGVPDFTYLLLFSVITGSLLAYFFNYFNKEKVNTELKG